MGLVEQTVVGKEEISGVGNIDQIVSDSGQLPLI
jgi:hypothetical protein